MFELVDQWTLFDAPARRLTVGALTMVEARDWAIASLAQPQAMVAAPTPWDITLPGPGCSAQAATPDITAIWTGPGQWFLLAPGQDGERFTQALSQQAPQCPITDQTDGWSVIDSRSTAGAAPVIGLLEKLVNLDPAALGPGAATRTLAKHHGIVLWRPATDRLVILVMRSYAQDLWQALDAQSKFSQNRSG